MNKDPRTPLTPEERDQIRRWIEQPLTQQVIALMKERTYRQAMYLQSQTGSGVDLKMESLMRMHLVDQLANELESFLVLDERKRKAEADAAEGVTR